MMNWGGIIFLISLYYSPFILYIIISSNISKERNKQRTEKKENPQKKRPLYSSYNDISFNYKKSYTYPKYERSRAKTYVDSNGYRRFSNSGILVHRYVASKKLGRKLRPGEVVHHKNRNKQDNSGDNLWVFKNQYEHNRTHRYDAKRYGKKASYRGF